jgi:glutamate/aspartate transport system substrate-binding protein
MKAMQLKSVLVAAVVCAGCTAAFAEETIGTLDRIRSSGAITIGHREASIPFSYYDKDEKVVGYAMELCYRVADAVKASLGLDKLDIRLVPVTPSTRIPSILSEKIDIECGTTTNNLERQKVVAFSTTYFVAANRFVAKAADNLRVLGDLKGRTVVSTIGATNLRQISVLNEEHRLGLTIVAVKDNAEAFRMLESDRAAAVVQDDVLLYSLVANSAAPADYAVSSEALSVEPYGIMMRRNDAAFKKVVDGALSAIYGSGEIDRIYAKWFLAPVPPNGVNLHIPMSATLRHAIDNRIDSGDPAAYRQGVGAQ